MTITLSGNYKQKLELFGHVLSHHEGAFAVTKPFDGKTWTQAFGPLTITETLQDGHAVLKGGFMGLSQTIVDKGAKPGTHSFKMELDSGNWVKGTYTISEG